MTATINLNELMFNPNEVNLSSLFKREIDRKEKEIAEAKAKARKEKLRQKYSHLINVINLDDTDASLLALFNELIPDEGKCDTVAGELVRAVMWIERRNYNDGEIFYEGYGLETCGQSIEYLCYMIEDLKSFIIEIIERNNKREYDDNIKAITIKVLNYILNNPETFATENTIDSRGKNDITQWLEDYQPRYEYSFTLSDIVYEHYNQGNVSEREIEEYIEWSYLDNWGHFEGAEVEFSCSEVCVENLTVTGYDEIKNEITHHFDSFWKELEEELNEKYGDPFE